MPAVSPRLLLRGLLPFALHALAREIDAAIGLLLHTGLDLPSFVPQALGLVDPARALRSVALVTLGGAALWVLLARLRRSAGQSAQEALADEARGFSPLLLRPALTLVALACLGLRPTFPYGSTLPIALTQDWGIAQDVAAAAALLAFRLPRLRIPAPGAGAVFLMAFLSYALLTPERARHWDGHPGNEPKYLRMGVSLGYGLSLDVAEVSALPEGRPPLESLEPEPLLPAAGRACRTLLRESARMLRALGQGPDAVGAGAIRATRLGRQTVEGKEGGVFHVLAPGPSLLLAPTLRIDRALNMALGQPGRLAVSVLAWNALGAALVAVLFLLLRDVTGRPGLAAAVAGGLALVPPFLFYFFQFYPEMPGALLLTWLLRRLLFGPTLKTGGLWLLGAGLAALPWLHQKFLAAWLVLALMAAVRAVDELVTLRGLLALAAPQALSLYLTALWNFGISGSVRPDALFLAWGPGGVTSARIGEGALGLLLDARYGLLPCAPFYLLAAGGLLLGGSAGRRLLWALPAVASYYLTVAAADNWSGSVCNLGRYAMPAVPYLVALAALALAKTGGRRGVVTLALCLAGWTGLLAVQLWNDPRAANDSGLLLAKSALADGNVYVPNLFFRSPLYRAPGHEARTLAWIALAAVLGLWLRRVAAGRGGESPPRLLFGSALLVLAVAVALERWPSGFGGPRFPDAVEIEPGVTAFVSGAGAVDGRTIVAERGELEVLLRSKEPVASLPLVATGAGRVAMPGRAPLALRPGGVRLDLPLDAVRELTGRRGAREWLSVGRLRIEPEGELRLAFESR
jgi:hypothetical protein